MRIALYTRPENPNLPQIEALMRGLNIDFQTNPSVISSFDLAVSLGGDGTFLSTVRKMSAGGGYIPILGINSGRLGFLSSAQLESARAALEALLAGHYQIEQRTMLNVAGLEGCNSLTTATALNEFTAQKLGTSMVFIELFVNDIEVASYWADGIIISTPTGSTAYSMSVGGAILTPQSSCFIVSPIAAHNLSLRPLVVPDSAAINLKISTRRHDEQIVATVDNCSYQSANSAQFNIVRSSESLHVINLLNNNFYATLRQKLHWGIDIR